MKTYFSLLDAVRFFAAFWVMNFHYFLGASGSLTWYRYGNLGVQLFFIISGFVIVQSLYGKSIKDFAIGRFIRLFPLFWILCSATFLITLVVPHTVHVSLGDYAGSMTMLGDQVSGLVGHGNLVDSSYWTLGIELLFYCGIALFVAFFSYKRIRYLLGGWLLFSMTAFALHIDGNFYVTLLLVRHASYFVFGGALALIATSHVQSRSERYLDWTLLFGSAIFALVIESRSLAPYITPHPLDTIMVTALQILFFIGVPMLVYVSRYVKNPQIIRLLAILGGLTYPLYLLHQRLGNTTMNYVAPFLHTTWANLAIGFEILIIAIAYVVYTQDKKMRSWLKKKLLPRVEKVVS